MFRFVFKHGTHGLLWGPRSSKNYRSVLRSVMDIATVVSSITAEDEGSEPAQPVVRGGVVQQEIFQ